MDVGALVRDEGDGTCYPRCWHHNEVWIYPLSWLFSTVDCFGVKAFSGRFPGFRALGEDCGIW